MKDWNIVADTHDGSHGHGAFIERLVELERDEIIR